MKNILKILLFMISVVFVFCGCGGNEKTLDENRNENTVTQKDDGGNLADEEVYIDEKNDEEVEIVFKMIDMNGMGIEEYVEKYNTDNPETECYVYNDECYAIKIMESERLEFIEKLRNKNEIEDSLKESLSESDMGNVLISIDYDDSIKDISFYVNKEEYEKSGFTANIYFALISVGLSDRFQAYSLIPVEERSYEYKIIDSETAEIIYEYNSKDNQPEEKESEKSVDDMLFEIKNWYIGDIWNNFVDFDSYRTSGKDCTGSEIDIEFAYDDFLESYELKDEYNSYINSLPEDYEDLKSVWSKMNEQIENIYNDLETNGLDEGLPRLELDLLRQYSDKFYEYF